VPIHRHSGVEACFVLSGTVEVLRDEGGEAHWIAASPGDFIEVPSNAKHGFRNRSQHPVVQLITISSKLGRLFQEIGRPITRGARPSPPSPDELQRLDWNDLSSTVSPFASITQIPRAFDFESSHWPSRFHHTGPFHDGKSREKVDFPWERLTIQPPSSPYQKMNGLYMMPRTIDKMRAQLSGGKTGATA
jgi:hypothetical protein